MDATNDTRTAYDIADIVRRTTNGLTLEIVGSWLWVWGDTYPHRDALRAAGLRWSSRRGRWHWAPEQRRGYGHSRADFQYIEAKYGAESLTD